MNTLPLDRLEILKIKSMLIAESIQYASHFSNNESQIIALVLSNSDIILWKATNKTEYQIIKWIPWDSNTNSRIQALTFKPAIATLPPSQISLLFITYSGMICILSADKILKGESLQNHIWKFDLQLPNTMQNFVPTSIIWWNCSLIRHKSVAIIGGSHGEIIFYSLTEYTSIMVLNTNFDVPVTFLSICCDFFRDYSYLLVTDDLRRQWKLLLEKEINGESVVLLSFQNFNGIEKNDQVGEKNDIKTEKINVTEKVNEQSSQNHQKSRLQEFKQMSIETFALLKQKLTDTRKISFDKQKENISIEPSELQSCDCYGDAFLSVQEYKHRRVLTGLFIPEAVLLLYLQNKDSMTLIHHKFKISPFVTTLLLTNTFIYIADVVDQQHRVLVFSTRLSESKKNEHIDYNPASFVQSFTFDIPEHILGLFKVKIRQDDDENTKNAFPFNLQSPVHITKDTINQIRLEDELNENCLIVTNKGVYIISLKKNALGLIIDSMKIDMNYIKQFSVIFNFELSKLVDHITDQLIKSSNIRELLTLSEVTKCYSGKTTLKLGSLGFVEELLEYATQLLKLSDLDLPLAERIHFSNFIIFCFAEQYLRNSPNETIRKNFLTFLKENHYYDEEMNIRIMGNYKLFSFVHFLVTWRGLYIEGTLSLTNSLISTDKFKNIHYFEGFWELFSEKLLIDSFILSPRTVHLHIQFIREHLREIPLSVLELIFKFYDPTQTVLIPAMSRMLRGSVIEYLQAYDYQNNKWGCDANMFDWVTNFLYLHIHLFKDHSFDYGLIDYVTKIFYSSTLNNRDHCLDYGLSDNAAKLFYSSTLNNRTSLEKYSRKVNQSSIVLSAGYAHAALVKNGSLVMWGQSLFGCLGTGPTLSQNCVPAVNTWYDDHRIRVKYVSCGRHHTLALTENGVYAWGLSNFGQLGFGCLGQSAYPCLVESLSSVNIVNIHAGQYHSLAIDDEGKLWSWGWGVYGQLGHGNTEDQYYPKYVEKLKKKFIVSAYGGQAHSVVLTNKGKVFTFGCNTFGQLGIGSTVKNTLPVKVFGIQEKIVLIATSYFHSLAVSASDRLYTWGSSPQTLKLQAQLQRRINKSMQNTSDKVNDAEANTSYLDLANSLSSHTIEQNSSSYEHISVSADNEKHLSPILVDISLVEGKITQISCGLFHSALLTSNNHVYTWGRNMDGQLGNCKRQLEVSIPTSVNIFPLKFLSSTKHSTEFSDHSSWKISCGKDYTLVELDNRLFGWGNNSCGQLGTLPQEESKTRRLLNGKFILNKNAKRMLKLSHGGINVIDKPVEIQSLPKLQFLYNNDYNYLPRYAQLECNLDLPGFNHLRYPIRTYNDLRGSANATTNDQILHYYLECFYEFYNTEFLLLVSAENHNFQAASKICCLNSRFFEAFFYAVKALLSDVRENYYFTSFKDTYGSFKNRITPKKIKKSVENEITHTVLNCTKSNKVFEFIEDVVTEAAIMFENYLKMIIDLTPSKIEYFLKKSLSVWIKWELPIYPLEWLFPKYWNYISYPLAVFLFCDNQKTFCTLNNQETNGSSHIEKYSWNNNTDYKSPCLNRKEKSYISNGNEMEACYKNLYYSNNSNSYLECNSPDYKLSSDEILQNLSIKCLLELCEIIVDYVAQKSIVDLEEFVHFFHEIVFAPSTLKSDGRSANEIFSSILNILPKNQTLKKRFIHLTYEELREQQVSDRFIVFSCSHYFLSKNDFQNEISSVIRKLDRLRLFSTRELVNQLYTESLYNVCCPECLFRSIECEIIS